MIYNFIHFDLRKYKLVINHHFILESHVEGEAIDSIKYLLDQAKVQLNNAKLAHSEATNTLNILGQADGMDIKDQENDLAKLNETFQNEIGFSYENLLSILDLLNTLNTHDQENFPLTILSIDQIISHIQENGKQKISSQEVENMLRFLSLKEGIYEDDNLLIPANMMRNKERINVSPFIELKDGKFLYGNEVVRNALNLWIKPYYGDFPFQLPKDSEIHKAIKKRHQVLDKQFEQDCISQAINTNHFAAYSQQNHVGFIHINDLASFLNEV
ncbi:MAG: hypothetical protein KDE26_16520 [Bacteroidetes bacterium]|nr:hypothetical protein [Bacteroidota bacterium]